MCVCVFVRFSVAANVSSSFLRGDGPSDVDATAERVRPRTHSFLSRCAVGSDVCTLLPAIVETSCGCVYA